MRRRNWATWLFALLIALVLWFYVVSHQNLTRTLQVPVEMTGVRAEMTVRAKPASAAVAVTGPRQIVERVTADHVHVRTTLPSRDPGDYPARLQVVVPRGLSARVTPEQVRVHVERRPETHGRHAQVTTRAVPIVLTARGQPARGYRIDSIERTPPIATVAGEADVVEALRGLPTAALALEGVRDDVEARLPFAPPPGVAVLDPDSVYVIVHIRAGSAPMRILPPEESR